MIKKRNQKLSRFKSLVQNFMQVKTKLKMTGYSNVPMYEENILISQDGQEENVCVFCQGGRDLIHIAFLEVEQICVHLLCCEAGVHIENSEIKLILR